MATERLPDWCDRRGMTAWAEGMAAALRRRVSLTDGDGRTLISAGEGRGDALRLPLEVNGAVVGWLVIEPEVGAGPVRARLDSAIATFQALAEVRNSMADLVRTTARQWRELSLLYRSTDMLRGGQDAETLADGLVTRATRAIRGAAGAVHYRVGDGEQGTTTLGDGSTELAEVAAWGRCLDDGVLVAGRIEVARLGFAGDAPDLPMAVVPLRCGDDSFGCLALVAERMLGAEDLKLAQLLAGLAGQAFANLQLLEQVRDSERLQRELEVAAEIQTSVLPPAEMTWDWLEVAGTCAPAEVVGGDAYFLLPAANDRVLAGIADVCGHGLSSAVLTNVFASQIKALAMTRSEPSELLEIGNNLIVERVGKTGMFITVLLMGCDPDGTLTIVNAGHPPPLFLSPGGKVTALEGGGIPIGILARESYPATRVTLPPGALVVAYSDGLTEASDPSGAMYGPERLVRLMRDNAASVGTASGVRELILDDLSEFCGGEPLADDLTLVVMRRLP